MQALQANSLLPETSTPISKVICKQHPTPVCRSCWIIFLGGRSLSELHGCPATLGSGDKDSGSGSSRCASGASDGCPLQCTLLANRVVEHFQRIVHTSSTRKITALTPRCACYTQVLNSAYFRLPLPQKSEDRWKRAHRSPILKAEILISPTEVTWMKLNWQLHSVFQS